MPQIIFSVSLGSAKAGLNLESQLIDEDGADVGSPYTTGFQEIGQGNYLWNADLEDDFRGVIKFYEQGETDVLAVTSVNPTIPLAPDGLDQIMIGDFSLTQTIELMAATLCGVLTKSPDGLTISIKGMGELTERVIAQCTKDGQRLSVTLNPS